MRALLVGGAVFRYLTWYYCIYVEISDLDGVIDRILLVITGFYCDACQCSHGKDEYCNPSFGTKPLKRLRCIPMVANGIRRFGDMSHGGIYCDDFDRRFL